MVAGTAKATRAAIAFADRRPGVRAHAAADHHRAHAGHHDNGHETLGLAGQPGSGVGGEASLGGEQQQQRHGENGGGDNAQCPAFETPAEVARDGVGAELAQEGREQHAHEDQSGADAKAQAQRIEADGEERAGQSEKACAPQSADGKHEAVEECGHPAAAGEIVIGLARRRKEPDRSVKSDGSGKHQVADR